ncbi:uncharacterized protein TNCV_4047481 [Trichonephila clavipes]|nr:uncharacterized protein TNCV_4047481 [Trichonephila clavipes]
MYAAFKSICITLVLVVAYVECADEECGVFKRKCKEDQFCFRPNVHLDIDLGVCMRYSKKALSRRICLCHRSDVKNFSRYLEKHPYGYQKWLPSHQTGSPKRRPTASPIFRQVSIKMPL